MHKYIYIFIFPEAENGGKKENDFIVCLQSHVSDTLIMITFWELREKTARKFKKLYATRTWLKGTVNKLFV